MDTLPFDPALLELVSKPPAKILPYEVTSHEVTLSTKRMVDEFVNVSFGEYCKTCSCYGNRWSCPPHEWEPVQKWLEYDSVTIYLDKLLFGEEGQAFIAEKGMTVEEVDESKRATMTAAKNIRDEQLLRLEAAEPGSLAISPGTCRRCNPFPCKREQGLTCDSPKVRSSFSSYCGDVSAICEKLFDVPLKWAKSGELPEYYVLVGALLHKDQPAD